MKLELSCSSSNIHQMLLSVSVCQHFCYTFMSFQGFLWGSIHLLREEVAHYSLQLKYDGNKTFRCEVPLGLQKQQSIVKDNTHYSQSLLSDEIKYKSNQILFI